MFSENNIFLFVMQLWQIFLFLPFKCYDALTITTPTLTHALLRSWLIAAEASIVALFTIDYALGLYGAEDK